MLINRLKRLQEHLLAIEAIPDHARERNFGMASWYCGTSACAMGEACLMPEFQEEGLYLDVEDASGSPVYRDSYDWEAAELFFGLNEYEANRIFHMSHYEEHPITPGHVAARIGEMVAIAEAEHA